MRVFKPKTRIVDGEPRAGPRWHVGFTDHLEVRRSLAATTDKTASEQFGRNIEQLVAVADFEPSELQDLGDAIPKLLELKAKANLALRFQVRIEVGDGKELPTPEVSAEVNKLLGEVKDGYEIR